MPSQDDRPISQASPISQARLPPTLVRRVVVGLCVAVGVYAMGSLWLGWHAISGALAGFAYRTLWPVVGLTLSNYVLRFVRWRMYLRALPAHVAWKRSLTVFLAGFSMAVSPGKVGEVLKAYLLLSSQGLPLSRTAGAVLAERITDVIALLLLVTSGLGTLGIGLLPVVLMACLMGGFLAVLSSRRLSCAALDGIHRLPLLNRKREALQRLRDSTASLFRPRLFAQAVLLATAAWFCECLGTLLIAHGMGITRLSVRQATFVYSASTLGGLPTPGGLGLTEGGMAALLHYLAGAPPAAAGAVTLLVRLCTLWLAVALGLATLLFFHRYLGLARPARPFHE